MKHTIYKNLLYQIFGIWYNIICYNFDIFSKFIKEYLLLINVFSNFDAICMSSTSMDYRKYSIKFFNNWLIYDTNILESNENLI